MERIDKEAEEKGISRAQWACTAINAYLNNNGANNDEDVEQLHRDLEQAWRDASQLRKEKEQASTEAEQLRRQITQLQTSLEQASTEASDSKNALEQIRTERDKLQEALKVKDGEVTWLRDHIAQLTQSISQLSLKPSEEEIKKKGWNWRFWK